MKKVTNKLPMMVAVSTALALAFVIVHQSGVIQGLKEKLGIVERKLDKSDKALEAERTMTKSLQNEIVVLEDSIGVLHLEIAQLDDKIAEQKETIRHQNKKIQKLEDSVKSLSGQISQLKKNGQASSKKIQGLEAERDELLVKMEGLDRQRAQAMRAREKAEQDKRREAKRLAKAEKEKKRIEAAANRPPSSAPSPNAERPVKKEQPLSAQKEELQNEVNTEIKTREQERIKKIVTGTTVEFSSVSISMKENGKPLDKLKKDGWKSTRFVVNLNNPDHKAIIDESFIVQVFDLDENKVIPVNEANIRFPDSNQGSLGYRFDYEGTPLNINYFNTQKKTGKNFELRLFYAKNGVLFPLKNGTLRIVRDGLVM